MDRVVEELDDAKAEIEKLRAECRAKAESSDNLKRSHTELLSKIQELNLKLEKQSEEFNAKTDEVYAAEQLLEDLKRNLREKVAIIKSLNASNERLRTNSNEKMSEWEEEKTKLLCSLEEANSNNIGLEQKIRVLEEEIEGVKERFVSVSQKKCSEANKVAKASKEMRERDDMLMKTEEEYRKLEDQLKWKKEQFLHLEEAHQKLKDLLKTKETEWEIEKSMFLDEISTQQENLDSQTRVSEDLQRRLESCNQALAREESRRKCLEIQLSESKLSFETEEEYRKLEDQLKWKKEQFLYLEEAHQKLKDLLKTKETEWEIEKSTFLDEISTQQENLDSQTRVSEDLQRRLESCNQALAREESRRKCLEIQLSESKLSFESVFSECEEAKSKIECLTDKRDKDIAYLRTMLGEREAGYKEMKYKIGKLEEENQDLKISLKELREAQIQEAGSSKIRNKLKSLEQIHKDCSSRLKAKESEWSSQFETVKEDLNFCRSELDTKELQIEKLRKELDDCNSLITSLVLQREEFSIMAFVLKSQILEGQLQNYDEKKDEKDLKNTALLKAQEKLEEESEKLAFLMRETDLKNIALIKALENVEEEREKRASLLKSAQEEKDSLFKSLDRANDELLQVKSELRKALKSLDRANDELAQKFCDGNELEFELQIWKSFAERLKADLDQNHRLRKEVEASLLEQVSIEVNLREEKDCLFNVLQERESRIEELEQRLLSIETVTSSRKERKADELEKEMELWEQEWLRKELESAILAQIDAEKIHQHEKESLNQILQEKDQRINDLQQIMKSLEKDFEYSSKSFSSELVKMRGEINLIHEAWEKMAIALVLKEIEVEEKKLIIVELENEVVNSDEEKRKLGENIVKYSSERESLVGLVEELSDRFGKFSSLDTQSMETLGWMVRRFNESEGDELFDPAKENLEIIHASATGKRVESSVEGRSPLRARNY